MMTPGSRHRLKVLLLVGGLSLAALQPAQSLAAGYGSLAGIVSDSKGVPLMGATVMVLGPTAFAAESGSQLAERMVTDGHGRFTIAHLVPGWYSLKVSSPTRLPAMRNGVRVDAGTTVVATFILTDALSPIRFQMPSNSLSSWGDDWKWVLRTSSNTRPILRLREQKPARTDKSAAARTEKAPLPRTEYVAGILPGFTPHDPLAEDFGMASVFAFLRPITPDSDVLTAGSFAPFGAAPGTVGAAMIRNQLQGTPQSFGLVYHQFNLAPGASSGPGAAPGTAPNAFAQAKGLSASYSDTRLIAPKITVTAGMDVNYLNGVESVFVAEPRVNLEYQATAQSMVSVQYGSARGDGSNAMMDRLSMMYAFPQITQRDGRLAMEQLNHAEVAFNHRMGKSARVQAAAYHDNLHNAAVWGWGAGTNSGAFTGNVLPNPAGSGVVINAGNYRSAGFRAVYAQTFGSHLEVLAAYSSGSALSYTTNGPIRNAQNFLTTRQTNALMGKITAQLPATHTRLTTSYEWVPNNAVTLVDPAGQGNLQIQPYMGMEIRQPIPVPSDWPIRIDAVADFQNMLSQGLTASPAGQKSMVLSPSYHYVRGGFAVEF